MQNLQSTNWQTMRFKPPPPNSDIGWRVEFRPMEVNILFSFWSVNNISAHIQKSRGVFLFIYLFCCSQVQLTDFENAAYVVFVVLLTRVILSYKLDFLIPLSKVKKKKNSHSVSIHLITIILSLYNQLQSQMNSPFTFPLRTLRLTRTWRWLRRETLSRKACFTSVRTSIKVCEARCSIVSTAIRISADRWR